MGEGFMSREEEKRRRKELLDAMAKKSRNDFEAGLPMKKELFKGLFDFLDDELSKKDCDDTNRMTKEHLEAIGLQDVDAVLDWLEEQGGYCDCEVLSNVEELFEFD
jgi:hypothetical protein